MLRLRFALFAVLLLALASAAFADPCDDVSGRPVSSFAATMTAAPGAHLFTGSQAQAQVPAAALPKVTRERPVEPLGCTAAQCQICNNNGLICTPVAGACCCQFVE
jgi:hypothetical protein